MDEFLKGLSNEAEFETPENYFEQLKKDLDLKMKKSDSEEFVTPEGYFEKNSDRLKNIASSENRRSVRLNSRVLWSVVGGVASVLSIFFLTRSPEEKECVTFACLLEQTTITQEDLEYFEEFEELEFYDDDEYE